MRKHAPYTTFHTHFSPYWTFLGHLTTAADCLGEPVRRSLKEAMRILRQFAALVLLLVTYVAPAMACMVPNAVMNAQERACCRAMKSQCGQMEMPASQDCCQKVPPSAYDNALHTKAATFHPVVVSVIWLAAFEVNPAFTVTRWVEHPDCAPPTSPLSNISILRI